MLPIITIHARIGNGQVFTLNSYEMEKTESDRLSADWKSYLETGSPKSGSYKYNRHQLGVTEGPAIVQDITVDLTNLAHID